jgi:RNA polymerase sigma-70 factor (ECF subfamily)
MIAGRLQGAEPPVPRDSSDEALLVAYREGDRGAFRDLIDRYRHELLAFLTRFLSNRAAAEDVFQETFLQIHLSADSFDAARTFKPWLFTIAANKARDHHRRQKRRAMTSLSAPLGNSGDAGSLVDLIDGQFDAPESSLEREEEGRLVKEVVDGLPSHYREILLLAYFQRMSYQQVAEVLSVPLGTVKSRLHAAVACFAESWRVRRARGGRPESAAE